jgi:hypothetical protein
LLFNWETPEHVRKLVEMVKLKTEKRQEDRIRLLKVVALIKRRKS